MQVLERDKKYLVQCYTTDDVVFTRGKGVYMYDQNGKAYLDFSGQFSSDSLGHGSEEMIQALTDQFRKIANVTSCFPTEERAALAEKMAEITPDGLEKVMFGVTGSDANEFALKAAKLYKGGGKILSFRRGFHGSTAGSAAATGKVETIQENVSIAQLLPGGFIHTAPPYCYRCEFGKCVEDCEFQCLRELEETILREGADQIAALITEPIFAAGGVIVVVGNVHDPVTYDFMEVNGKEVDIMTTFRYRNIYPMAINAIAGGKIDVKKVATNFMKFEDIQEAFEIAYKQKQTALKVVVEMPENEE